MQQFFAEPSWITESEILIRGADLNHMKNVLRMKVGEDVRINDGQGTTYLCCLNRYEKDQAVLDVFRKLDTETELPSEIILFQGLPKGDKDRTKVGRTGRSQNRSVFGKTFGRKVR